MRARMIARAGLATLIAMAGGVWAAGTASAAVRHVVHRDPPPPGNGTTLPGVTQNYLMDIKIRHTARPHKVRPGGRVDYTVTVTPLHGIKATGASLAVDLSKVVDDAAAVKGLKTTVGAVRRHGGRLVWDGDLAPNKPATITFNAVVNRPDHGDHVMITQVTDNYYFCRDTAFATCKTRVIVLPDKITPGPGPVTPPKVRVVILRPTTSSAAATLPRTGAPVAGPALGGAALLAAGALLLTAARPRRGRNHICDMPSL